MFNRDYEINEWILEESGDWLAVPKNDKVRNAIILVIVNHAYLLTVFTAFKLLKIKSDFAESAFKIFGTITQVLCLVSDGSIL